MPAIGGRKKLCVRTTVLSDIEVTLGAYGEVATGDRIVPLGAEEFRPWIRG